MKVEFTGMRRFVRRFCVIYKTSSAILSVGGDTGRG